MGRVKRKQVAIPVSIQTVLPIQHATQQQAQAAAVVVVPQQAVVLLPLSYAPMDNTQRLDLVDALVVLN